MLRDIWNRLLANLWHLENNREISRSQHRFVKKNQTHARLIAFPSFTEQLVHGDSLDTVYMDFSKVFGSLRDTLVDKIKQIKYKLLVFTWMFWYCFIHYCIDFFILWRAPKHGGKVVVCACVCMYACMHARWYSYYVDSSFLGTPEVRWSRTSLFYTKFGVQIPHPCGSKSTEHFGIWWTISLNSTTTELSLLAEGQQLSQFILK